MEENIDQPSPKDLKLEAMFNKWRETGILDGLNPTTAVQVAHISEQATNYLLQPEHGDKYAPITNMVILILRDLCLSINSYNNNKTVVQLIDEILLFHNENWHNFDGKCYNTIECEVDFCKAYVEHKEEEWKKLN